MRHLRSALLVAGILALLVPSMASAAKPPVRGILASSAHPGGHSLLDLATDWTVWGFGTSAGNPNFDPPRCEQSTEDGRFWFLPVFIGVEVDITCTVPPGSFLVMFAGGGECSDAEAPPWHGGNEAELRTCVDENFELITYQDITVDGVTTTALDNYVVRTRMVTLPADNLLSADPTISMTKGYFAVIRPLSRGTHTLANYTAFGTDFAGGSTYTIHVH